MFFNQILTSDHYLEMYEASDLFVVPLEEMMDVYHSLSKLRPSIVEFHVLEKGLRDFRQTVLSDHYWRKIRVKDKQDWLEWSDLL